MDPFGEAGPAAASSESQGDGREAASGAPVRDGAGRVRRCSSRELFGGSRQLVIEHGGRDYLLLITRQGKLLLNRRP